MSLVLAIQCTTRLQESVRKLLILLKVLPVTQTENKEYMTLKATVLFPVMTTILLPLLIVVKQAEQTLRLLGFRLLNTASVVSV